MKQCVDDIPGGPVRTTDNKIRRRAGEMKQSMEALIHHFKLYTEGYRVPAGRPMARGAEGEFGVYLVADGTNKPYRCKIRAPGFAFLRDGLPVERAHVGRHGGDRRFHGYRFRGDRPVSHNPKPLHSMLKAQRS